MLSALFYSDIISVDLLIKATRQPLSLAIGLLAVTIGTQMSVLRWHLLMHVLGIPWGFRRALMVTYIGLFASTFIPGGSVSGDVLRTIYVCRDAMEYRGRVAMSVIVDRLFGLIGLLSATAIIGLLCWPAVSAQPALLGLVTAATGIIVATLAVGVSILLGRRWATHLISISGASRLPLLMRIFDHVSHALACYRNNWRMMALCMALSLLTHLFTITSVTVIAIGLHIADLPPLSYSFAAAGSTLANVLPLTPGGLGIGEGVFEWICRTIGGTANEGFGSAALVARLVALMAVLPGALAYVLYRRQPQPPPEAALENPAANQG